MTSSTSSGASSMLGKPGIRARLMPAITSRMEGATFSRGAEMPTATSTASSSRKVCTIAVMNTCPAPIIQGERAPDKRDDRSCHGLTVLAMRSGRAWLPKTRWPGLSPAIRKREFAAERLRAGIPQAVIAEVKPADRIVILELTHAVAGIGGDAITKCKAAAQAPEWMNVMAVHDDTPTPAPAGAHDSG